MLISKSLSPEKNNKKLILLKDLDFFIYQGAIQWLHGSWGVLFLYQIAVINVDHVTNKKWIKKLFIWMGSHNPLKDFI